MNQPQRGAVLVSQARLSASRLIDEANELTLFRWLDDAGDEGRDLYNRVRQLHDIARDVEIALRRREEQLQDEGNKRLRGEDVVWKNTKAHLERCHHILNKLRRLLIGWDAEFEPTRTQTLALQIRLSFVQKKKIASLHNKLNWQFKALQLNTQAVNQFIQIDTQERIGATQERLEETNARISKMSDLIMEHMKQTYEQQQAMYEQQRNIMDAIQGGLASPAFSVSSTTSPVSIVVPRPAWQSSRSSDAPQFTSLVDNEAQQSQRQAIPRIVGGDGQDIQETQAEDIDGDDDQEDDIADRKIMKEAIEDTRSVLCDPFTSRRGSSVALETNYTESDASASEYDPRHRRRLSSNANQKVTFATAGDYLDVVAQFSKKPEEDYDDLLKDYNERAKVFLRQKKYDMAEEHLIQAIQIARDRQKFYETGFDEIGMQDLLGQIYLQGKRFQKALGVWVELLPRVNDPDQVITLQHCHHFYLVAEVFYRMWKDKKQRGQDSKDDLLDALKNADSAYNKRCEIIGKSEAKSKTEVRLAADLLGRIHEALGNSAEAKFYYLRADGIENPDLDSLEMRKRDIDGELADGQKATAELHKAVRESNVPRALALLKNKKLEFDLERPAGKEMTKDRLTMLMLAFDAGSEPIVKALLERGADIGAKDIHGRTVVHRASASGDATMAYLAVRSGKKGSLEQKDKYGLTPILLAVAENKAGVKDVVETLLAEEANINAVDINQDNIIHFAARNSSRSSSTKSPQATSRAYELLRHLVTHPRHIAPINAGNGQGNTPLMLACENGHAPTAEVLLKNGADVNAENSDGQSALWLAIDEHAVIPSYEDTVRTLLLYSVVVNEKKLPKKWKDFRHLAHSQPAGAANDASRTQSHSSRDHSRGRDSLTPSKSYARSDTRRDSATSRGGVSAGAGRKGSVSTTNTAASKSSSKISRMFSFTK